jgi:hypothetical protein
MKGPYEDSNMVGLHLAVHECFLIDTNKSYN